jgi:aspartate carbamoyltransferase catalytic subunit
MEKISALISLKSMTTSEFDLLAEEASYLENQVSHGKSIEEEKKKSIALIFFEPSTRTRMSFERAASLLGHSLLVFTPGSSTSLEKGESLEDTYLNILALKPDMVVLRCGSEFPLSFFSEVLDRPALLCAGWGHQYHPTQALLDAYTLWSLGQKKISGQRILYVGDAYHSRVLGSHKELLPTLGCELGQWCPEELRTPDLQTFSSKEEALSWADVVVGLRLQTERLETLFQWDQRLSSFQITLEDLKPHKKLLLHPGPVGWGQEFNPDLKTYQGNVILNQVTKGVFLRAALIKKIGE